MLPLPDPAVLATRLRQHVEELAATPRPPQTPAHDGAAAYVRRHFERAGFAVEEDPFRSHSLDAANLLTRPLPERPGLPLLVIGAHYDSLPDTPGADDNASAVAALLELATWAPALLADGAAARLQLAAYDMEEWGLVGSGRHARRLRKDGAILRGMLSLEMLGYIDRRPGSQRLPPHLAALYPDVGDFIGVCGNEASRELVGTVTAALKSVPGLPVESIVVPGRGEALAEVRLSDHSSFWDAGYPALMVTDTSFFRNPHYHRATDTPSTLDYDFLARVTVGLCEAVRRLLR